MQPISMMRSPSPAFRPVVSVSSTTRRIARSLSGTRRAVKSAAAVAVDVRADDRVGGAAHRPAGAVHEPHPHQPDEEAAGRGSGDPRAQARAQLPRAPGALVDLRQLAGELAAARALAVELSPELA